MNNIEGLVRQLVSLLRYFAAPIVAAIIVWLFDENHDIFNEVLVRNWTGKGVTFSLWPLTLFLAVLGIFVYFAHRTVFHPLITLATVKLATRNETDKPSVNDLHFERWRRRGAAEHSAERSSQAVLDEANAAGHFFYCSCWTSLLLISLLDAIFPTEFCLGTRVWGFIATVVVLFALGIINDLITTNLDFAAYGRFKNNDAQQSNAAD